MHKKIEWEKFNDSDIGDPEAIPGVILSQGRTVNEYKDFDLFIAHVNFYVNINILERICSVEGLEAIDLLSPYRFRIAVGKLFEPDTVIKNIEKAVLK